MNNTIDLTTSRGCVAYLIDRRFVCRGIAMVLDDISNVNISDRRQARKLRQTKNQILARRADTLESQANNRMDSANGYRDLLMKFGRELMEVSSHIDTQVPQALLLDILNVNSADRSTVAPGDGIVEIAYIRGLEDSAMYRDEDCKQGPIAQAVLAVMMHELRHNEQLKQAADEYLFGKGGMFEFLPMYHMTSDGGMERLPPKLRLAEECDVKCD